ncbi:XRE family transcriptional regulator [Amycolatopsis sp. WQ 127309]|uniref:helix-turn-helix domain-containing protein n=1 Tax=Amycolatopsis sp. WQ 127309 TaxID=2932773 RepID=UPI001FF1EC5E|nr:XRE family transcriptional regulator [Amycolatopsis sp. WQ 127309]UOZ04392.1 XRE family transcriptional regulator [Amycolatopsis sp. WQ 127309]
MTDPLTLRLAATVHAARTSRGLSVAVLAEDSGVSRAMIGKIERGDVQPTAALLAKLSSALGMTLTELIARAEGDERRLVRAAEQPVWVDPDSGYRRRSVSPASGRPLELVEIELPAGAAVPLRASTFLHQQIWVLAGHLRMREGAEVHELDAGDCLQLGSAPDRVFENPGSLPCRYLVALVPRTT